MILTAAILTAWAGVGDEQDPFRPLVLEAHPLLSGGDITFQPVANLPCDPNLMVLVASLESESMPALAEDERFCVLWSE